MNQPRESDRLVRQVQGDLYQPYGPEDGWMFQVDPDAAQEQGQKFGRAIKNGIVALRREGKKQYAEDLGARPRHIPAAPPPQELPDTDGQPHDPYLLAPSSTYPMPPTASGSLAAPVPQGLVDQYGRPYDPSQPARPRRSPPREVDFEPFDPDKAWAEELRRAEARVRGEQESEPDHQHHNATGDMMYSPETPLVRTAPPPTHAPPTPTFEMKSPAVSPTYPEFLNADGTIPRRPCGATTVITLRNRDHVIECQEEIRDINADHPHYGLPHLALVTTSKRGHRVFIGWHEEE